LRNIFLHVSMNPMEAEESRTYEAAYLLKGDLGEEKAIETGDNLRRLIEDEHGIVSLETRPRKQKLAYSIKKYDTAFFGSLKFILPAEKIALLRKHFEKFDLLRLLLNQVKYSKEKYKSSFKKRLISRPASQSLSQPIIGEVKNKNIAEGSIKKIAPSEEAAGKKPLQVEEIDKKIEEILNQ